MPFSPFHFTSMFIFFVFYDDTTQSSSSTLSLCRIATASAPPEGDHLFFFRTKVWNSAIRVHALAG